jgi:hypothetical protein
MRGMKISQGQRDVIEGFGQEASSIMKVPLAQIDALTLVVQLAPLPSAAIIRVNGWISLQRNTCADDCRFFFHKYIISLFLG